MFRPSGSDWGSRCSWWPWPDRTTASSRTSLAVFFVVATVAIATYVTGNGAESVIKGRPDVSQVAIRAHEDAALLAFTFMEVHGLLCLARAVAVASRPASEERYAPIVLLLAVVTFFLMAKAATLGGEITPFRNPDHGRGGRDRPLRRSNGTPGITISTRRNCWSGTASR